MRRYNDSNPLVPPLPRYPGLHLSLSRRIPLISLKYVLAVANHLNFQHAADALGVSQSSVSTRVRQLEDDLGITLFERRHRGVRLTEVGRRFATEIALGIQHLDHAVVTAGAILSGTTGRLSIGSHASIGGGFFAELRKCYRERWSGIELVTTEGATVETIRQVRDGSLDITFVLGPFEALDCHSLFVWSEAVFIAMPVAHKLADRLSLLWEDLAQELFIVRQGGAGPQVAEHVAHRISERDKVPHIIVHDVGRDTILHMVAAGEGITLVSEATTLVPLPGVVYRAIADEPLEARFYAVWSPHNSSPALRKLLDLAKTMSHAKRKHR